MDKNLLELWGETLLGMAKMAQGSQSFFELFQNGFAKKEREPGALNQEFVELCKKVFGKEGIETFNAVMKEFYENAGVVPRTQYNELRERYFELKEKVRDLEEEIEHLRNQLEGHVTMPDDLMDQWNKTAKRYAEINQQFFKEFSKFFD